ncbi:unnamed protein product, partial [Rotaria magnacalcarata]
KMKHEENYLEFKLEPKMNLPITEPKKFQLGFKHILTVFANQSKFEKEAISNLLRNTAFDDCKSIIRRRLGCEHTCPGCGVKCSKPSLHPAEQVKVLPEYCQCQTDECICPDVTYVDCVSHENDYHIPTAFHGERYHKTHKPYLHSCYQQWTTVGIHTGDGEIIHPKRLYYNKKHLQWYKNLDNLAKTAPDKDDPCPSEEQRRAWMTVRHYLTAKNKMNDYTDEEYDEMLYPKEFNTIPINFQITWKETKILTVFIYQMTISPVLYFNYHARTKIKRTM